MKRRRIITTLILTLTLSLQSISVFAQPNKEVSNISSEKTDINNEFGFMKIIIGII